VEVGDGSRTRFWHGLWCGDHPLNESFPELFFLERNRDAMVDNLRSVSNDTVHWDINFTRLVHDWEVEFVLFLQCFVFH
jgi:hypothetical protein